MLETNMYNMSIANFSVMNEVILLSPNPTLGEKTVVKGTIFDEKIVMDRKSSANYSKI